MKENDWAMNEKTIIILCNCYSIYLMDATADNIVVDAETLQITFVDLDTMVIADSQAVANSNAVHCHEQIDCDDGCFAYSPNAICSHHLSDINLYAVCQVRFEYDNQNIKIQFMSKKQKKMLDFHSK